MKFLFLDVESFYSTEHSLTKLDTISYVLHPGTEILSLAVAEQHGPVEVLFGEKAIRQWVARQDWKSTAIVAHNTLFDGAVMAWRFGVKPAMWCCTLSMSRPHCGKTVGGSLKAVSSMLGVGEKLDFAAVNTKGKRLADLTPEELELLREYNKQDTHLCREIFKRLLPLTPKAELKLIDHTIRMMVQPRLQVDVPLLEGALIAERQRKADALSEIAHRLGVEDVGDMRKALQSGPKFAALLESLGATPPTKISPTTGKSTYAFAKTDEGFLALQEHENPLVAAAASARLGTKSSILESRIERFIGIGKATSGWMPVSLNYFGALNSGRYSGGGSKTNLQNLSRVDPDKPKPSDVLRRCLRAPKGYKLVASDLSGIEMRVLHYMWDVHSTMRAFADDPEADLYRLFGAELYRCSPKEITKPQRQLAKAAMLGLQYGAGAETFHRIAKLQGVDKSLEEITEVVTKWREVYSEITYGWKLCGEAIEWMAEGIEEVVDRRGIVRTGKECLHLPGGVILRYPDLRREREDNGKWSWYYGQGRNKQRIYAPKLTENITQAVSRLFLTDAILKVDPVYPVPHHVHDEIVCVTKASRAEECLAFMNDTLRTPPWWFPDIVLFSEGDYGDCYADVK